jgi:hypothetical protein
VAATDWRAADSTGKQNPGRGALLSGTLVAPRDDPPLCPPGRAWPVGQDPRPGAR